LGAERAIWLTPAGAGWQVALARDAHGQAVAAAPDDVSQGVVQWVADRREPLSLLDVANAEGWRDRGSVQALGVRTLWCAPAPGGVVYLDLARGLDRDPAPDLALLQSLLAFLPAG
ncbi:MAG: hypothetical protein JWM80_6194, partial [Cyanobacteria bacterium RYN_339]|nr:hypothetical protein [Cyanobacteria bacterium RYN_339]